MIGSFEFRYINIGLMAALIAELLILVLILNLYMSMRRKEKRLKDKEDGARLYDRMVCAGTDEAHMLVRRSDRAPLFFTGNFEQTTGIAPDRLTGDIGAMKLLMGKRDYKIFCTRYENWNQTVNSDQGVAFQMKNALQMDYRCIDGSDRWMRLVVVPDTESDSELYIFRDVTVDRQAVEKLEQELEKAEEESQSKTTFLSRMSHEIRTPINGIIGMMTLSHKLVEPGTQIDTYLEKAEDLSEHLVSLVNDILDMSRIEAGKIELEHKAFDVRELADKLRNMFQENIEAKKLRFSVELVDFTETVLVGDEFRLSQVLVNFLSNAVKFTSEGEITVTFKQMLLENNMSDIMIRVHDTGIGMAPEFMNRIFKPFEQENASISHNYGGTGLGMAITDQIVRLMGGEIVIDSMPGHGSDFTVYLHLPVADDEQQKQLTVEIGEARPVADTDDYTFAGKNILMAEDNEINAEIASAILKEAGASVDIAGNGQEAVRMVADHQPGYYDFVLMDIQMPVMDGREAARQIRSMDRPDASELLIFALSADAFYEDERLSIEAGMNGHFAKPVNFEEVRKKIGQTVKSNRGAL